MTGMRLAAKCWGPQHSEVRISSPIHSFKLKENWLNIRLYSCLFVTHNRSKFLLFTGLLLSLLFEVLNFPNLFVSFDRSLCFIDLFIFSWLDNAATYDGLGPILASNGIRMVCIDSVGKSLTFFQHPFNIILQESDEFSLCFETTSKVMDEVLICLPLQITIFLTWYQW